MGYWSYHPMGGDSPLDEQYKIYNLIIKNEETKDYEDFYDIPYEDKKILMSKYAHPIM